MDIAICDIVRRPALLGRRWPVGNELMRIIAKCALREFWQKEKGSEAVLIDWYRKLSSISPRNLAELHRVFPTADLVGQCYVFNVGGNKYRVVTRIHFNRQIVYIRSVMTHSDYDKDKWKADC